MADGPKTITVDQDAARAAERKLGERVDAEVRAAIDKERKTRMDEAQLKAALDAAQKEASAARSEVSNLKAGLDQQNKLLEELVKQQKAGLDAAKQADEKRVKDKASKLAMIRAGLDASKVKPEEVARLVGLGEPALDDQLALLTTPGVVSAAFSPPANQPQDARDGAYERTPRGHFTVKDWAKVAAGSHDPQKAPMGVRA